MAKKALLMILDGWGIGPHDHSNAIYETPKPYWDSLIQKYPHSKLQASGENVGLPDGQMGNSEVGHLNIGAGRIVYQDLVKINRAIADGSIMDNPEIKNAYSYAKQTGHALHLMGLTSTGGVHSSLNHILALCDIAKEYGLEKAYLHCFMDGRDTDPHSGISYIKTIQEHCAGGPVKIASIIGRFYAMDRDKRWNRVKEAYDLLIQGTGVQATDMVKAMQYSYDADVTDEFVKPINNSTFDGTIKEGDVVIFFNYRNDRAKELTVVSTKSMTGHLLGGAGGIEAVFTALALHDQFAPPTIHYEQPDPECDLDYVPNTGRAQAMTYALSNSLGFGGHNACIALRRWEG